VLAEARPRPRALRGFGGIAYDHVSDLDVALFSRFIPCGAYAGVYILDPLWKNKSDIQPDTVHADTHGQSAAIFGLSGSLSAAAVSSQRMIGRSSARSSSTTTCWPTA
jgi:hypothetical protein